ncbi:MAG: glycosyltransferase family 39 protein [Eubacterium sp.]|nr:glycosyltransferase family 39 protein [Eubacterium sp.]
MFKDIITVTVLSIITFWAVYKYALKPEVIGFRGIREKEMKFNWIYISIIMGIALIIKLYLAFKYDGYIGDINCFRSWSDTIYNEGIGRFYYVDEGNGYPPGYLFVLWIMACLRHLFKIDNYGDYGIMFIKLVPILCDIAAGFVIYKLAKERFSEFASVTLAVIYALSPITTIDSAIWGQVDSVFTLCILLVCYLCMKQKRIAAYFVFCLGALLKFQTIMFAPILIYTIIDQVFLHDFNVKKMVRDLVGGLGAIASMFIFCIPFGLDVVIPKYINSLGLFEYCTINAYNFWAIVGKNWVNQNEKFLFVKAVNWGTVAIFVSVALSALVYFKMKNEKSKYFMSMAVLLTNMFLFSVRMHERYLFPAIVLLLAAFIYRPCKEVFFCFASAAVLQFLNVAHVYYAWAEEGTTGPSGYIVGATAVGTIFFFGYTLYAIFKKTEVVTEPTIIPNNESKKDKKARLIRTMPKEEKKKFKFTILPSAPKLQITKIDLIAIFSLMAVYSFFAFRDLGNAHAPETGWFGNKAGQQIVLDFGEQKDFTNMYAFCGNYEGRIYYVEASNDGTNYNNLGSVTVDKVFKWNDLGINASEENPTPGFNFTARYIRFSLAHNEGTLLELAFKEKSGKLILPVNKDEYKELFDEQDEYVDIPTFRDGTYFDEIYHARTAYEMIHHMYCYENTHPPLGKFFISLGVRIFGMNPFGWRIVGTVFGVGMIPLIYMFGLRLFRKRWMAIVLGSLFAFDFMHFAQTRIATIDVYGTFFIMAMFYFMLRYAQTSFYDTEFKKTLIPLGLAGVMMGLGCASKWTAVYAAAGLAVFFFAIMFQRYREFCIARNNPGGSTEGISHKYIAENFTKYFWRTIGFCVIFFMVIPGLIYLCSYIPFSDGSTDNLFMQMINNQKTMYSYHSQLDATHPYSSVWYEWPVMIRPVFYYSQTLANGLKEGISAFGNPLVWWAGIFATIHMVYRIFKKHDRIALFMIFAYLVQYLPWMLVERCTFAYHYFPSVPFVAMMVVYSLSLFWGENPKTRKLIYAYCGVAFAIFVLFYPLLSGQPVKYDYVKDGLQWLSGWVLTI